MQSRGIADDEWSWARRIPQVAGAGPAVSEGLSGGAREAVAQGREPVEWQCRLQCSTKEEGVSQRVLSEAPAACFLQ